MTTETAKNLQPNTFLDPLCTKPVKVKNTGFISLFKKYRWLRELTAPLRYVDKNGKIHEIPIGFRTDGGSIPRIGRVVTTPFAPSMVERYVLHDFRYETHSLPRKESDQELYDSSEGRVSAAVRKITYRAVRIGGGKAWKTAGRDKY